MSSFFFFVFGYGETSLVFILREHLVSLKNCVLWCLNRKIKQFLLSSFIYNFPKSKFKKKESKFFSNIFLQTQLPKEEIIKISASSISINHVTWFLFKLRAENFFNHS